MTLVSSFAMRKLLSRGASVQVEVLTANSDHTCACVVHEQDRCHSVSSLCTSTPPARRQCEEPETVLLENQSHCSPSCMSFRPKLRSDDLISPRTHWGWTIRTEPKFVAGLLRLVASLLRSPSAAAELTTTALR